MVHVHVVDTGPKIKSLRDGEEKVSISDEELKNSILKSLLADAG